MGVRGQYDHLDSQDATDEDVIAYLEEHSQYITAAGGVAMPVEQFWEPGDLARYWLAREVWAVDAPPRFALPDVPTMLRSIAGPTSTPRITFIAYLTLLWERYAAWMVTEGRDPAHPEESRRQRGARRARESVARSRELRSADTNPERAELLRLDRELYEAYMSACARRKEVNVQLDADVAAAKTAYDEVHAQLKG